GVPVVPVSAVGVGLGLKRSEMAMPAGTCLTLRPFDAADASTELSPFGRGAAGMARPGLLAAPEGGGSLLTITFLAACARMLARALSALNSLRSTLAPAPLRSSCTPCANCWPVGAVLRMDSNSAVTR